MIVTTPGELIWARATKPRVSPVKLEASFFSRLAKERLLTRLPPRNDLIRWPDCQVEHLANRPIRELLARHEDRLMLADRRDVLRITEEELPQVVQSVGNRITDHLLREACSSRSDPCPGRTTCRKRLSVGVGGLLPRSRTGESPNLKRPWKRLVFW